MPVSWQVGPSAPLLAAAFVNVWPGVSGWGFPWHWCFLGSRMYISWKRLGILTLYYTESQILFYVFCLLWADMAIILFIFHEPLLWEGGNFSNKERSPVAEGLSISLGLLCLGNLHTFLWLHATSNLGAVTVLHVFLFEWWGTQYFVFQFILSFLPKYEVNPDLFFFLENDLLSF